MNYVLIHDRLVERARSRLDDTLFYERHHVVPRCLGGGDGDGNIVKVTPKEHRLLHKLLFKIHPDVPALWFAANMMYSGRPGVSPNWLRKKVSEGRKLAWSRWDDRERIISAINLSWTDERRRDRSDDRKRYWSDLDNRKANSEKLKAHWKENKAIPDEDMLRLRELRLQGFGWRKLSAATGYAITTLRRYLAA